VSFDARQGDGGGGWYPVSLTTGARIGEDVAMDAAARRPTARLVAIAGVVGIVLALLVFVARRDPPAPPTASRTPVVAPPGVRSPIPSPPTPASGRIPFAPEPPAALRSFAELHAPQRRQVPVDQRGLPLRVDAVSTTGLLLGGAGFDSDPYRAVDRVGVVEPRRTAVRWLTGDSPGLIYGRAAGTGLVAWAEARDTGVLQVMCARAGNRWRPVQISPTGVRLTDHPVYAEGSTVAWTDESGAAWAADDCGRARLIGRGAVVAIALPVAYLRGSDGVAIVRLTGRPGTTRLPVAADGVRFAAYGDHLVWVANGAMAHYDRRTGDVRALEAVLPSAAPGAFGDLTVGNRLVVYTSRPMEGDPSLTRAIVYDLTTGAWLPFGAEVFAAGHAIVWREGDHYAVTIVH
jgi:hypothetical protein